MSFIVEKMSMSIKIQADNLVSYLPMLWEEGVEHNMLRVAIISALVSLKRQREISLKSAFLKWCSRDFPERSLH